ncbi:gamma-glutamyl-gamma-aminobutyrate hydrolase family protein [Microvirga lotononidis]|uniref:gamma-glutamyl-gamma-aminobutyrate hydrolase n=1 Tax=Microvirga lotononidis TaxID=864069 RepID=I4Z4X6_9HYPH|nr:gamma-glutamyl-gamma-aminobutyrate hydrolase family protein [Microvirga lotononidis]EIM31268.1 putative glutamine amidotransferase [Microvirga lotononidis]WQO29994.1 gamma-glutamyl-gamma-aminobutyrate hydrolase family protein [Microvirga lotononidis]
MPLVGVTANRLIDDGDQREWVRRRYIDALEAYAKVEIVVLPTRSIEDKNGIWRLVSRLDGLVLTGDESNIDPEYFVRSNTPRPAPTEGAYRRAERDPFRDMMVSFVLPAALQKGLPILGICRGLQELNVFFGGELYENISADRNMLCHKEDLSLPRDRQYDPVHEVSVQSGGMLARILGSSGPILVNSLHSQGIRWLASGLNCEAVAPDGLIEAASVSNAGTFQVGVQWHPEWHIADDAVSKMLFAAFGKACSDFESKRLIADRAE